MRGEWRNVRWSCVSAVLVVVVVVVVVVEEGKTSRV
jgi:hypothetical protein